MSWHIGHQKVIDRVLETKALGKGHNQRKHRHDRKERPIGQCRGMATQSLVHIALDSHVERLERVDIETSEATHLIWLYVPHVAREEAHHLVGAHLELTYPGGWLAGGVLYRSLHRAFVLMYGV